MGRAQKESREVARRGRDEYVPVRGRCILLTEDLRGRKAPVEPDEKPRPRKRRPQQREQPTQQAEGPVGGHRLPGPQHRRAQILLRLAVEAQKPQHRQITPAAIVPVEERELLGAVRQVVGWVQIDRDPARPPVQAAPMTLDDARCQLAPHPVEHGAARAVLESRDRGLRRQGRAGHRVPPEQQLVDGVVGQVVGIVAIGMTARDAEDPLADQVRERVPNLPRCAFVGQSRPDTGRTQSVVSCEASRRGLRCG